MVAVMHANKRAGTSFVNAAIFSRATKNGPAFRECFVCTKKHTAEAPLALITLRDIRTVGLPQAGIAPDPNWSSGFNKGGDPTSDMFCPGESGRRRGCHSAGPPQSASQQRWREGVSAK